MPRSKRYEVIYISYSKIEQAAYNIVKDIAAERGYSIYDVEYSKEGSYNYLRIFIDRAEGISLDDCEAVSRAADPELDGVLSLTGNYFLEVSSPGVERVLKRSEHFEAAVGKEIKICLFAAIDGRKEYVGMLSEAGESSVTLKTSTDLITVDRKAISKANVVFNF